MKTRQKLARKPTRFPVSDNSVAAIPPVVAVPPQQPPPRRELLREAEVCSRLRRHRSSLWRDVKNRVVPAPVRIGRSTLWFSDEIDTFISSLRRTTDSE